LAAAGVDGAQHLLPVTFLVIVGTVAVYGLTAPPLSRLLRLRTDP
jgi:NhaP-type Na+/H+ or K+/H+ antiporter